MTLSSVEAGLTRYCPAFFSNQYWIIGNWLDKCSDLATKYLGKGGLKIGRNFQILAGTLSVYFLKDIYLLAFKINWSIKKAIESSIFRIF